MRRVIPIAAFLALVLTFTFFVSKNWLSLRDENRFAISTDDKANLTDDEPVDLTEVFEQSGVGREPAIRYKRGDLWGFLDRQGRVAIKPQFEYAYGFRGKTGLVRQRQTHYLIDNRGTELVTIPDLELAQWASHKRIWVCDSSSRLWGLCNLKGKTIVPPTYSEVRPFFDGLASVAKGGTIEFPGFLEGATYSYIDEFGKNRFEKEFPEYLWGFREGLSVVGDEIINTNGEIVIPRPNGSDVRFSDGLLAVKHYGDEPRTEYIDRNGKVVLSVGGYGEEFSEGLAAHRSKGPKGPWGYVDKSGAVVIAHRFTSAEPFHEGLAAVAVSESEGKPNEFQKRKIGFIDRKGTLVIPAIYNDSKKFSEGVALVHQGGYQPAVEDASPWWEKGRWLIIDKRGKQLAVTELDNKRGW